MDNSPDQIVERLRGNLWSQLGVLLGGRLWAVVALAVASTLAGLTESGILAIVAQVAAALVNGSQRVAVNVGPIHVRETVTDLLTIGFVLALVRLALQGVVVYLPARIWPTRSFG